MGEKENIAFCVFEYEDLIKIKKELNFQKIHFQEIKRIPEGWNGAVEIKIEFFKNRNFCYIEEYAIFRNIKIEYEIADHSDIVYNFLNS